MKRVLFILSFLVLFTVLSVTNVNASECTTKELRELKALAKKVQVVYEFDEESKLFNLSVYNLDKKFYVRFSDSSYFWSDKVENIGYYENGQKLSAVIYGASITNCEDYKLSQINIELPFYNIYSIRTECFGKEKLEVCKKWSNTLEVDETDFLKQIHSSASQKDENIFEQLVSFAKKYGIYVFGIFAFIGVIIITIIVVKRKRKNKIESIRSLV